MALKFNDDWTVIDTSNGVIENMDIYCIPWPCNDLIPTDTISNDNYIFYLLLLTIPLAIVIIFYKNKEKWK